MAGIHGPDSEPGPVIVSAVLGFWRLGRRRDAGNHDWAGRVASIALTVLLAAPAHSAPSAAQLITGHLGPTQLAQGEAQGLTGVFAFAVDGGQQQYPRARARLLDAGKGLVT